MRARGCHSDPECRKEQVRQSNRRYRAAHREELAAKRRAAREAVLAAQDGRCAICGSDQSAGKGFHRDHNHVTGEWRGVLCHDCNLMLGHATDSIDVLRSAIYYLEKYQ